MGALGNAEVGSALDFPDAHTRARGCKEQLGRSAVHGDTVLGADSNLAELVWWRRRVP